MSGFSKPAEIAAAKDLFVGHELVAAHRWVGIVVGILVDELDDHVVVGAGGGGEDVGDDLAGDDQVLLEHRQLPDGDVFAIGDEALVFGEPVEPLRALAVGGLDGAMAIRDGVGGIADIAGFARLRSRVGPAQQCRRPARCRLVGCGFLGREVGVALPGVGAGLEAGGVFKVEAGFSRVVLQVVGEELGFDLGADTPCRWARRS